MLAVLAALFRHDYKKWDVKAQIAASQNRTWEVKERGRKAEFYLDTMRRSIYAAVGVLCGAFVVLTVALWV